MSVRMAEHLPLIGAEEAQMSNIFTIGLGINHLETIVSLGFLRIAKTGTPHAVLLVYLSRSSIEAGLFTWSPT